MTNKYGEMKPAELRRAIDTVGVAILPLGALQWHGNHLPLGSDGIIAETFATKLAEAVSGVLLPTLYTPMTPVPHEYSLAVKSEIFRGILYDTLNGLKAAGFRTVCIVSGNVTEGHRVELYETATQFIGAELYVVAGTPLEVLERDDLMDHAGRWETAQLLALRPDLVDLTAVPEIQTPKTSGILGEDPRCGKKEEAQSLLSQALNVWVKWIRTPDIREIERFYARRIKSVSLYLEEHAALSWEQATKAWWEKLD